MMRTPLVPNRRTLTVAAALGLFALAVPLTAQPPDVKPGPEHEIFKQWAGDWDATVKSMGSDHKGTQNTKVGLGGLWLLEHFKTDFGGMAFEGVGATSYDPAKKKYVNVWCDSMSTSPMVSEGTYDKAKKTLTLAGKMPTPDGKTMDVTMTTVDKDADTRDFTLKGTVEGKAVEMLQITYKRRK